MQVTVRDLMTSQPLTVSEQATVAEATGMILDRAVNELYVVDGDDRLLGMVSDFALLKARMVNCDRDESVTRYISRKMQLLTPDMRLEEVAGFFRESYCPRLAVVEDGHIIGQLSRRDILRAMVVVEQIALESTADHEAVAAKMCRFESPEEVVPPQPSVLGDPGNSATTALGTLSAR